MYMYILILPQGCLQIHTRIHVHVHVCTYMNNACTLALGSDEEGTSETSLSRKKTLLRSRASTACGKASHTTIMTCVYGIYNTRVMYVYIQYMNIHVPCELTCFESHKISQRRCSPVTIVSE